MLMKVNINMFITICPRCGHRIHEDRDNNFIRYSAIQCDNCHYQIDLYGTDNIQF